MNPETRHIPINAFMCRDVKTVAGFGFIPTTTQQRVRVVFPCDGVRNLSCS